MRRRPPGPGLLWLLVTVIAPGCGSIPATHYYMLEPRGASDAASRHSSPAEGLSVGVRTFQVDPPYDQDRIVYRVGEDSAEIGFYDYHRWAAPVARMLPKVVSAALSGAPGVKSMEPVVRKRDYEAYLEGRVLALEEIDTPQGQSVRVRLSLTLTLDDGTELWSESLAGESIMRTDRVDRLVERMSDVLGQALDKARAGLAQALRQEAAGRHPRPNLWRSGPHIG